MRFSRFTHLEQAWLVLLIAFIATLSVSAASGENASSNSTKPEIAERKQTTLGLYVTAKEAYEKWKGDPEHVTIIDVRTTDEFIFVGHPEMAWNIPFAVQTREWDPARKYFAMKPDPDFVSRVTARFKPEDTLLIICRSGDRGAMAVNALAKAGYKNVYNIIDGVEGDLIQDSANVYYGKRMKDGWKNSGAPWTYQINPKRVEGAIIHE